MIHRMNARFLSATLFFLCWIISAQSQLVLQIDSLPQLTPMRDTIFGYLMQTNDLAEPQTVAFQKVNGKWQFKFDFQPSADLYLSIHRGSEATVALDSVGGKPISWNIGNIKTGNFSIKIKTWADINRRPTVTSQVRVLDDNFLMPQLNTSRRVWVLLPSDYETSKKRYPVVYMQDGQNIFDATSSFAGEWGVDESFATTLSNCPQAIVVAVDNGGINRSNEYCAYDNAEEKITAQGKAYVDFLVKTLKPAIDKEFRTLTDGANTAIMGSSLGANISAYAYFTYPEVFSKIALLSPAYWINPELKQNVFEHKINQNARIYQMCGTEEGDGSVVMNMLEYNNLFLDRGYAFDRIQFIDWPDGQHSEWFWKREFPRAYKWLFECEDKMEVINNSSFQMSPNPAIESVVITAPVGLGITYIEVFDYENTLQLSAETYDVGEYNLFVNTIYPGTYSVKVYTNDGNVETLTLYKI